MELSILSSSDTTGERVIKNWNCLFCPVQIPQVRQSVKTGTICFVQFRYHRWESVRTICSVQFTYCRWDNKNYLFCVVQILQWESQWELELSVLFSSDTASEIINEVVSENCEFCPIQISHVRESTRTVSSVQLRYCKWNSQWELWVCPVQILQVRESMRTVSFVRLRYHWWESHWELWVLSG